MLNRDDVDGAFAQIEEVDAVVSTIGGTPADPSADSEGNINLIKVAPLAPPAECNIAFGGLP